MEYYIIISISIVLFLFVLGYFIFSSKYTKIDTDKGDDNTTPPLTSDDSKRLVQARVWQTGTNDFKSYYFDDITRDMYTSGSTVLYPEKCILPKCNNPNKVGLSFSGGGVCQIVAGIGFIRGLMSLGVFDKSSYVSGASGGSWILGIYLFARNNGFTSEELLGTYIPPENLTIKNLNNINFEGSQDSNNFIGFRKPIINENIIQDTVANLLKGKFKYEPDWFTYYIKNQFLDYYNLNNPVALNASQAEQINKNNGSTIKFNFLKDDDPFFICNGSIINKNLIKLCKIEFTPLYSGITNKIRIRDTKSSIGGYVVDTFAFNQDAPKFSLPYENKSNCTDFKINLKKINDLFGLVHMLGVTANAYSVPILDIISKLNLNIDVLNLNFFTNYNIWKTNLNNNFSENQYLTLTDGQAFDGTGIISLLSRGVKKIITFLYCEGKLFDSNGNPTLYTNGNICLTPYSNYAMPQLFGVGKYACLTSPSGTQVFQETDYPDFLERLRSNYMKGGATFSRKTLRVIPNPLAGVKGNYEVDLLVVCIEDSEKFKNSLPTETKILMNLDFLKLRFKDFPRYPVFFPNRPDKILELTKEQVNLLSSYTNWCVLQPDLKAEILDMYKE